MTVSSCETRRAAGPADLPRSSRRTADLDGDAILET